MATKTRRLADLLANIDDNSNITTGGITADTLVAGDIAANAIGASELADNAVDSDAIATNAVITSKIADSTGSTDGITTAKLATNAVTSIKITDLNVTAGKMAAGVVATKNAADPATTTNPAGGVGTQWINTTTGEGYVCSDATSNANVWKSVRKDIFNYSLDPANPYEFGDGRDGDATALPAHVHSQMTTSTASSGSNQIAVNSSLGFKTGDIAMLIQIQDTNGLTNGQFRILEISGIDGLNITFATALGATFYSNAFDSASARVAQLVRVPQYENLTLTSNPPVAATWNGYAGGIIAFKVRKKLTLTAKIDADGKGFRGGVSASTSSGNPTQQGEGNLGKGGNNVGANGCGGGGGRMNIPGSLSAQSGKGGGHSVAGTGGDPTTSSAAWGNANLKTPHLGFGGGGGAGGWDYSTPGTAGSAGGGIIWICAETITTSGSGELSADGGPGVNVAGLDNGATGAGGSIYVKATTVTTNNAWTAIAGTRIHASNGLGSTGRIHINATSITGTTNPTFGTA